MRARPIRLHYMPPAEALKHIASKRISFEEQKKLIPSATLDKDGADLKRRREKDRKQTFHASKVRADAKCKSCGAIRCIYSKHMIGKPGGPTMEELQTLEREIENIGYICGDKMSRYDGERNMCAIICYVADEILSKDEAALI